MKPYFTIFETVTSLGKLEPYHDNGLTRQYAPTKDVDAIVICSGNFLDNTPNMSIKSSKVIARGNISGSLFMYTNTQFCNKSDITIPNPAPTQKKP